MKTPSKARSKLRGYQGLLLGMFVLVLALGGVAVAMWTANGEGSGDAHAVTAVNVTLTGTTGTRRPVPGLHQRRHLLPRDEPQPVPGELHRLHDRRDHVERPDRLPRDERHRDTRRDQRLGSPANR